MLLNVSEREELTSLARLRARSYEAKTINPKVLEEFKAEGWIEERKRERKNSRSIRVTRAKPDPSYFEDRVWTLLYRFGFELLSNEGGAQLVIDPKAEVTARTQIDVVAIDPEVAIAIECKTALSHGKKPQFQDQLVS